MSLETESTPGGSEAPAVVTLDSGTGKLSVADAVRSIGSWREKQGIPQDESAKPATTAKESSQDDAAPPQEAPSETEGEPEPAEMPPIEPPRSWTKDEKERFNSLPRETQEYLAQRETERDREIRQRQNEAADARKAIEAERQRTEQTRLQYESALPVLLEQLSAVQLGQFGDIRTMDDVTRLSTEDPLRYIQFQAHREKVARVEMEIQAAQQRQVAEAQTHLHAFMQKESAKLIERVPELADKEAFKKVSDSAVNTLQELGFSRDELGKLWSGEAGISLHDHRLQMLLLDGIKYREGKSKQEVAAQTVQEKLKGVPPVQRPGVPQGKNAAREADVKNLNQQLDKASGVKALRLAAQLAAARRR